MNSPYRSVIAIGFTLSRVPLIIAVIATMNLPFYLPLTSLLLWLILDQLDGVVARKLGVDNIYRRIADVVIEHFSVTAAFMAAFFYHREYLTQSVITAWGVLACLKLGYSLPGVITYTKYKIMLRSLGASNKVFNLSQACLGLAMIYGVSTQVLATSILLVSVLKIRPTYASICTIIEVANRSICPVRNVIIENYIPFFGKSQRRIV
mgnify:FL=1